MKNRPAMRDGTRGYEWHEKTALVARCNVHLLRDAEESTMRTDMGTPQYVRHQELRDTYKDAGHVCKEIIKRAGGPITCASQLGTIDKVQGLRKFEGGGGLRASKSKSLESLRGGL